MAESKNKILILDYFKSIGYGANDLIILGDISRKGGMDSRLLLSIKTHEIDGKRLDLEFPYKCPCGRKPLRIKGVVYSVENDQIIHIGPICFKQFSNIKKERLKCKCGTRLASYSNGLLCAKCKRAEQAKKDKQEAAERAAKIAEQVKRDKKEAVESAARSDCENDSKIRMFAFESLGISFNKLKVNDFVDYWAKSKFKYGQYAGHPFGKIPKSYINFITVSSRVGPQYKSLIQFGKLSDFIKGLD